MTDNLKKNSLNKLNLQMNNGNDKIIVNLT